MRTWSELVASPVALREYLDGLDAEFARPSTRIEIPARALHAWARVQEGFKVSFSLDSPLFAAIAAYFRTKYGPRTLTDFAIGRMLIRIGHEAWVLRFPLCFGRVRLELSRMIENAPPGIVGQLTQPERSHLAALVPRAFEAFNAMTNVDSVLRVDWVSAVNCAVDPGGNAGSSKFHSQQVVEKVLCRFILDNGGTVSKNHRHDLAPILREAERVGLRPLDRSMLNAVQCKADARYPSNQVKLQEAIAANQASVLLCGDIASQWRPRFVPTSGAEVRP